MDNRKYNLDDTNYNSHTNDRTFSHLPSNSNQMVQPQRDYPPGYQQNSGGNQQQNNRQQQQYHQQHYGQPHSSNGQMPISGHPNQSGQPIHHSSMYGNVQQPSPYMQEYSYPPGPSNQSYMHPQGPPSHQHGGYGGPNYSNQPFYSNDEYQHNPNPQGSRASYTSYPPPAPMNHNPSGSGGYPSRGSTTQYSRPSGNELSPPHVSPQPITSQPPPEPVTNTQPPPKKSDNIGEFKKKAEDMKNMYLKNLDKMIKQVQEFKKEKNSQRNQQFQFDEIQKKLTLLKTLITADFKPNSNFPPRKEILEAAEKQINMWIEEWGKLFDNSTNQSGLETDNSSNPPNTSTVEGGHQPTSQNETFLKEGEAALDFIGLWDPVLDSNFNFEPSGPMDNCSPAQTGTSTNAVFYEYDNNVTRDNTNPNPNSNLDIPEQGYNPEAILGKRPLNEEFYESEQPPTKYPKQNEKKS